MHQLHFNSYIIPCGFAGVNYGWFRFFQCSGAIIIKFCRRCCGGRCQYAGGLNIVAHGHTWDAGLQPVDPCRQAVDLFTPRVGRNIWIVSGSAGADKLCIETRIAAGTTAGGVPTFCRVPDFSQATSHGIKPRLKHSPVCPVSESALGCGCRRLAEDDRMTPPHPRTRAPVQCLVSDRRSMGQIGDGTHWTAGILPAPATRQKPAVHLR